MGHVRQPARLSQRTRSIPGIARALSHPHAQRPIQTLPRSVPSLQQLSSLLESAAQDAAQFGNQGETLAQTLLSLASDANADKVRSQGTGSRRHKSTHTRHSGD